MIGMKQKKIVGILFVLIFIIFITLVIVDVNKTNLCVVNGIQNNGCFDVINSIGEIVLISLFPFLFVVPILFFVRREAFVLWSKFAVVGFPLMLWALFDLANKPQSSGFGPVSMLDGAFFAFLIPFLFFLISLILITYKSIKLRGK
jgi:hypothetical protein